MQERRLQGSIVTISSYFKRVITGDKVVIGGAISLRAVICWVFIALVALFLTSPSGEPRSTFDQPLPLPPELGLE
jgi:hypothetical protein